MKYTISANFLLVLTFALVLSTNAAAGGQHGPGADRMQQVDRDRTRQIDRDRMSGRDRAQDRARIAVPEQDRHRLESRDPSQLRDDEIYGYRLMTEGGGAQGVSGSPGQSADHGVTHDIPGSA